MLVLFRLPFQPAGEICAALRVTELTERIATTRIGIGFEQVRGARKIRKLRNNARLRGEPLHRAAVKSEPLEISPPRSISSVVETPDKERFS